MDLKNGTVDLDSLEDTSDSNHELMHDVYPSPNEDEIDIISLGLPQEDKDEELSDFIFNLNSDEDDDEEEFPRFEYDIDELEDFMSGPLDQIYDEVDDDVADELEIQINESLEMFKRFKKYN